MRLWTTMLAGAIACAGAAAKAQAPDDLPPLPGDDAPAVKASPIPPIAATMPQPATRSGCTPGHCTHRLAIARRRCRRHLQDIFLGYPEEFERPTLGARLYAISKQEVRNGEEASLTLREFDFESGSARLNRRGRDKLNAISTKLPTTFGPVIVERSTNNAIDDARRSTVLTALKSGSFPIPPERVIVGAPSPSGVNGPEAELIYDTLRLNTSQAGPPVGSGVDSSMIGTGR